jgi:hypothetical protein
MGGLGKDYVSPHQDEDMGPGVVYGVWVSDKDGGYWLCDENVKTIFHTEHLGVAFARMRSENRRRSKNAKYQFDVCTISANGLPGQVIELVVKEKPHD